VEEVVAHERQTGVRLQSEENARLPEKVLSTRSGRRGSDLQGHEPGVLTVESTEHAPLASRTDHLERLVAVAEELRHFGVRMGAGARSVSRLR
jgi:hypothetical protein